MKPINTSKFLTLITFLVFSISQIFAGDIPFITTWKTANPGASEDNQIRIYAYGGFNVDFDFIVDWGDGTSTQHTDTAIHTYETPGTYIVSITGLFPSFRFSGGSNDSKKLMSVEQWGDNVWTSISFGGCSNLVGNFTDTPDLTNVESLGRMFEGATNFNSDISNWDVSNVRYMSDMFNRATAFNQDIGNWDVSNVEYMRNMFKGATSFNQDISNWDVSNVSLMDRMFEGATSFNKPIGKWDVSNAIYMFRVLYGATSFNQPLGNWDISNVKDDIKEMFRSVVFSVENYDDLLIGWSTKSLPSNIRIDFGENTYCSAGEARLKIVNDFGWYILDGGSASSKRIDPLGVFGASDTFELPAITGDNLTGDEMYYTGVSGSGMSYSPGDVLQLSGFNEYPAEILLYAYANNEETCISQEYLKLTIYESATEAFEISLDIFFPDFNPVDPNVNGQVDVGFPFRLSKNYYYDFYVDWGDGVTDHVVKSDYDPGEYFYVNLQRQFDLYNYPNKLNIKITGVFPAFEYLAHNPILFAFNESESNIYYGELFLSVTSWGNTKWTTMKSAFAGAKSLAVSESSGVPDLTNVEDMSGMFNGANVYGDLSTWDVSNVSNMSEMFLRSNFDGDLSAWDVSNVADMSGMFLGNRFFDFDISTWDVSSVTNMSDMFRGALKNYTNEGSYIENTNFNQNISSWNVSNVTDMSGMFAFNDSFNQDINSWDVSKVSDMSEMFKGAENFNQNLGSWNVSKVSDMSEMFRGAENFNQNLGSWNVVNVASFSTMLYNTALSIENYDSLLQGWSVLNLQSSKGLSVPSTYCDEESRQKIIDDFGWTFYDEGLDPDCATLKLEELNLEAFALYPNPANSSFYLETKMPVDYIVITNTLGKTVKSFNTSQQNHNIEDLNAGLYFVNVYVGNEMFAKKLVKN